MSKYSFYPLNRKSVSKMKYDNNFRLSKAGMTLNVMFYKTGVTGTFRLFKKFVFSSSKTE